MYRDTWLGVKIVFWGKSPKRLLNHAAFRNKTKSQFYKKGFKLKDILRFMLSSWADLFKDGVIKRGHAFHSVIH